ncbi:helix-turn-helix domain-containing protein [Nocardioides sp. 503]|uniref:helix-turn-helix domain-containing protein n=1 Tax=Nocardioides sp. 503 TaxID=2508326 RepID=UPI0014312CEF|nr:helix-turn-helix domain-containing protein [Nocardioides sp. 503]
MRRFRLARDLTLEALAARSGISDRTVSDIERGASLGPQRRTVELIADGLALGEDEREALLAAARAGRHRGPDGPRGRAPLPRGIADFTGRETELARLAEGLRAPEGGPAPVALVHGPPGLGKTALAVRAASLLGDSFETCVFVDLRGFDATPVTPLQALTRLISTVDPSVGRVPHREADAVDIWQELIAHRQVLVVLDNAANESQVRALLPRLAPAAAILTSRRPLAGLESIVRVLLVRLRPSESVELLRRIVPLRRFGDDGRLRDDAIDRLAALCDHVPLALRIAGNRLASREAWSARDLIDRLAVEDRRIDGLRAGDLDLRATIAPSYEQLSPPARRVFRRLALLPAAPFGDAVCAQLSETSLLDAQDLLDEISDLGLLQGAAQGRFELHDLLRLFARERLVAEEDEAARERVALALRHWLLHVTIQAGRRFEPEYENAPADVGDLVRLETPGSAHAWLETEADHWFAAFQASAWAGEHRLVAEVAESLHWFSDRWTHWGHWHEVYAAGVAAARALSDDDLLATQLGYLAWAELVTRADPDTALLLAGEAREVAARAGNPRQEGWACFYESWAHLTTGSLDQAWSAAERSAPLLEAAGDREGVITVRHHTAEILQDLGRPEESMAQGQLVLELVDRAGPELGHQVAGVTRIGVLVNIATSLALLGRHEEVVLRASQSITLQQEYPSAILHVRALRIRARASRELGLTREAETDLRAALDLCRDTGDASRADQVEAELRSLRDGAAGDGTSPSA